MQRATLANRMTVCVNHSSCDCNDYLIINTGTLRNMHCPRKVNKSFVTTAKLQNKYPFYAKHKQIATAFSGSDLPKRCNCGKTPKHVV